jgi:hypothetical protein
MDQLFLKIFVAFIALWSSLAIAAVVVLPDYLPAPRISSSHSFNEKARWLRTTLRGKNCDVVVLGSSMAVNNFDGEYAAQKLSRTVINVGSFGMTPSDDIIMLRILSNLCVMRTVIMPVYHGDLARAEKQVDWGLFERYVAGGNLFFTYISTMDFAYYIKHIFDTTPGKKERRVYTSLHFDSSGGVGLQCGDFEIEDGRWRGYEIHGLTRPEPEELNALQAIGDWLSSRNVSFIVAPTPLRRAAIEHLGEGPLDQFWQPAEKAVTVAHGYYVIVPLGSFDDALFVDYNHLNSCGAGVWTEQLLDRGPPGALFLTENISLGHHLRAR